MSLRRTPLFDRQRALGARFVDFGGWEMPVQFAGIQAEHDAVRQRLGLFDVSHMGEVEVRGPEALAAVDRLVANDLSRLEVGQALYTCMCREDGGILDDLLVYRLAEDYIFICCNAGNRDKDFAWITARLTGDARAVDRGDDYGMLALQGRRAPEVLSTLTTAPVASLGRFRCARAEVAGIPTLISRTGYTGEDGYELYLPSESAGAVWDALFAADPGLVPVGLGARDTLRLEMKMCLYGNDIDETTTPLEANLGWATKLEAGDFIGREALRAQKRAGVPRRLVAFKLDGRAIGRHGYPVVDEAGAPVGHVTSGTRSPTLGVPIGMAYVPAGQHRISSPIRVKVRDRVATGSLVGPPFVKPGA